MNRSLGILVAATVAWSAGCVSVDGDALGGASPREAALINAQLGTEYLRQGRRDLAREKLERALEQDPRLPEAHLAMAYWHGSAGDAQRADQSYRTALRYRRADPEIRNAYGVFLCQQGRLRDAEEHLVAAARTADYATPEVAWTNAGICAEKQPDLDKAERYYREALRIDARHEDALWQMAQVSFHRANALQARGFLQRYFALGAHTRDAPALWLGYQVETTLGDNDAARTFAARLLEDFGGSDEARALREAERARGR